MLSEQATVLAPVINAGKVGVPTTWKRHTDPCLGREDPGMLPGGGDIWAEA